MQHPDHKHSIILVSSSVELAGALQGVINGFAPSVEDLPVRTALKGVILDQNLSREVDIAWVRRAYPTSFIAIFDPTAAENPTFRFQCFEAGANMVAHDIDSLVHTLQEAVIPGGTTGGHLQCPYCFLGNLSEREMWFHCPAYHVNYPEDFVDGRGKVCPICRKDVRSLQVHIHEAHNPLRAGERNPENRIPNQLYNFSLVFCRHPVTGKFLLCQEFANQGFWCPGGAVDGGETFTAAARRETLEEAGIEVELKGILAVEYNPAGLHRNSYLVRMRVIFYAEPTAEGMWQLPKSRPDFESVGACWCSVEDICGGKLKLRGNEPRRWCKYLAEGGPIYPLTLLSEGSG